MKRIIYLTLAIVISLTSSLPVAAVPTQDISAFSCTDVTEIPQVECEALVALYNSTNGFGWTNNTNWLVTNTPSDWYGVGIYSGRVSHLILSSNLLSGPLPSELSNLSFISSLTLDDNLLTGVIPAELSDLSNLAYL
jgi:hypothetical protein